jgi:MarR family transcriptional regulator, lower aerobic nicotinate degradation pathway regulator
MDPTPSAAPHEGRETDLGLVDALAQLSFLVTGLVAEVASGHDTSMAQTRLLGVLRDRQPGMNELAMLLDLDKSSVTGLVDRAEKRGLVTRRVSAVDRRAFQVSLTGRGRRLVDKVAQEFQDRIDAIVTGLSVDEQVVLSRLASRVVVGYAAEHGVDILAVSPPS